MSDREKIVRRVAAELRDGMVVNLGIGMPTLVADYVLGNVKIVLQSDNGILGMGSIRDADKNIINAGGQHVTVNEGACFFDSATSFVIIRGGHIDVTVLGALQVDEAGNLASHIIPGKMVSGMGGAMDLVTGSKKVIIAMTHTSKENAAKILKRITLPATAIGKVSMIVTELAVIQVTPEGLLLKEIAEGTTVKRVQELTGAPLKVDAGLSFF